MASPNELHSDLIARLESYKSKYIDPFIPVNPSTPASDYDLEVRSYCILCHACFEEFYESIALVVLKEIEDAWVLRKISTRSTVMLLCSAGKEISFSSENNDSEVTIFDSIRKAIKDAKQKLSKSINDNHGASPKYLRNILMSVGLEFNPDPMLKNSIIKLADERGKFAHKGIVKTITSPEDALVYVSDCIIFSETVKEDAIEALQQLS